MRNWGWLSRRSRIEATVLEKGHFGTEKPTQWSFRYARFARYSTTAFRYASLWLVSLPKPLNDRVSVRFAMVGELAETTQRPRFKTLRYGWWACRNHSTTAFQYASLWLVGLPKPLNDRGTFGR